MKKIDFIEMMKAAVITVACLIALSVIALIFAGCSTQNELSMYKEYYTTTEKLLDNIEDRCNISDVELESDIGEKYLSIKNEISQRK
jgi:hypothetical protein